MGIQAILDPILATIVAGGEAVGTGLGAVGSAVGTGLGEVGTAVGTGLGAVGSDLGIGGAAGTAGAAGGAAAATLPEAGALTTGSDLGGLLGLGASGGVDLGLGSAAGGAAELGSVLGGSGSALTGGALPTLTTAAGEAVPASLAPSAGAAAGGVGASVAGAAAPAAVGPAAAVGGDVTALGDAGALGGLSSSGVGSALADTGAGALSSGSASGSALSGLGAAGAGSGAATATSAAPASLSGLASGASSVGNFLLKNPGVALAGLGLGSSLLSGDKKPEGYAGLETQAASINAQGAQLEGYLNSGTLPPGVSAGLKSAHDSAAATIRSQYASRGQTGSSAEAQDLANLSATTVSQGATIATQLLQQGVSEEEFATQLYQNLMQVSMQQDQQLSNSIASFSGALAGSGLKGTTLKLTG